ncbi:ABC transporter substrate-binding protein [Chelativorans sp. M5D2P16]|uniref:ABC transporter substrate-binding protein n=1 Tax=Chelativorans sp. M5D2P16 TaxID=3095678 RepID=UPI002ACA29EB|nr:extracellular solute-binding protein [Chelativorans sp. M5D2P16]MDZ5700130.1 extracellular solute-binding protein [Chelativorans sp. M5D2P16]
MRPSDRKLFLASIADRYARGGMDRRAFLRSAAKLGLGAGALGLAAQLPFGARGGFISPAAAQGIDWSQDMRNWLTEVGKPFAGQTIRLATESTPPSNAINSALKPFFEEATGINVEIEVLPLEQVLQKLTLDVASGLGTYDLYYIDQSWMASFSGDVVDPRERYESSGELAMPGYDFDDFLPALVDGISMYDGIMVGVPYDIPIFIQMYRRDIFEELGLNPATTMEEFLSNAQAIQEAKGPEIYGTTGQMRSGHYSLECDWTAWLWGHGGSIFSPDGKFVGNDERGMAAMEYWQKLKENMPPGVDGWTWDGQGQSVGQGLAATVLSWGEFFPSWDDPANSQVSGLMEATVPPSATSLRTPEECGFNEIPGVGHQGGSSLAVSKYAKSPDAAWIFAQWATSKETQVYITTLGGGTGPTRSSVYDDPRVKENAKPGIAGTTRHLDAVRETIANHMGSEPDLPEWAEISNDVIPVELGRFWAGEYDDPQAAMDAIKEKVDAITSG